MPYPGHLGCGQRPGLQGPPQGWAEPHSDLISPFPSLSSCFLVSWENGKLLEPASRPFPISGPRSQHCLPELGAWPRVLRARAQPAPRPAAASFPGFLVMTMASVHDEGFARLPGPLRPARPQPAPPPGGQGPHAGSEHRAVRAFGAPVSLFLLPPLWASPSLPFPLHLFE